MINLDRELKKVKRLMKKSKPDKPSFIPYDQLLSTGSTELNLACSGRSTGGLVKGKPYLFAGDASSGKTWLSMSCLAEASINENYDDYDLYFDAAENGMNMDVRHYFGDALYERLLPPNGTRKNPIFSDIQENYYDRLEELLDGNKPILYVTDSMDALRCKAQIRYEKKQKEGDGGGSFAVDRAKVNSARLRAVNTKLRDTGSILIMIAQSRQKIGFGAKFDPKTFSGGDALKFYPRIIIWTSIRERIRRKVKGMDRIVGQITTVKVAKNHINGWEGRLTVPYLRGIGIDDVGSCVDFLVTNKHWSSGIDAAEFGVVMKRDDLIHYIEETDQEALLRRIVTKQWHDLEEQTAVTRKNRYRRD